MATEPRGFIELLVKRDCGQGTGADFVTWAVDALTEGLDSPSLRRLAALDNEASRFDALPLFENVAKELNLRVPDSKDALYREFLRSIAHDILNGIRSPAAALELVHRTIVSPLGHPADLMPWCYLWGGLDPNTFASLDDEAIAEAAKALARDTVRAIG